MLKKGFGEIVQQPFLGTGFTVTEVVIGCLAVFFLVLKIGMGAIQLPGVIESGELGLT